MKLLCKIQSTIYMKVFLNIMASYMPTAHSYSNESQGVIIMIPILTDEKPKD